MLCMFPIILSYYDESQSTSDYFPSCLQITLGAWKQWASLVWNCMLSKLGKRYVYNSFRETISRRATYQIVSEFAWISKMFYLANQIIVQVDFLVGQKWHNYLCIRKENLHLYCFSEFIKIYIKNFYTSEIEVKVDFLTAHRLYLQ